MASRIVERFLQPLYRERVFRADINESARCPGRVRAENHALNEHVRIAFYRIAVHVSARIALVCIAHDEFLCAFILPHEFPLDAGRKTGAAAPPEVRFSYDIDNIFRIELSDRTGKRTVPPDCDIFLDTLGIYHARIPKYPLFLSFKKGNLVPFGNVLKPLTEYRAAGTKIPPTDLRPRLT